MAFFFLRSIILAFDHTFLIELPTFFVVFVVKIGSTLSSSTYITFSVLQNSVLNDLLFIDFYLDNYKIWNSGDPAVFFEPYSKNLSKYFHLTFGKTTDTF